MGLVWDGIGAYSVVVSLVAWGLAAMIYSQRPDRAQNRFLALALVFEGFYILGGSGMIYLVDDPRQVYAFQWLNALGFHGFMPAYLALLGTLDTPLARPFRPAPVRIALFTLSGAWFAFILTRPSGFIQGVRRVDYATWDAVLGPHVIFFLTPLLLAFTYALLVAFDAWRRTQPRTLLRSQALIFLIAFGFRDVLGFLQYAPFVLERIGFGNGERIVPTEEIGLPDGFWFPTHVLVFNLLVAYGILKHQLFAIDLRIKWTMKQGTIAAAFVAVFFVVSELAQQFFSGAAGPFVGVLAAGLLVFGLAPLQRFAERLSNVAMPAVQNTPEYVQFRKFEVYRAALEGVAEDREVTSRERTILERLRAELKIAPADARSIEEETLLRARASATNS